MTPQAKQKLAGALLLGGMSIHTPAALALFEPGFGLGLQYTDNAGLTPDDENEDLIVLGYVGANIEKSNGPATLAASTSLTYENYTDDTFDEQYYFDLSAIAGWEMVRDRVNWRVRDFFTQRLRDSIDRSAPDNIEDVNIFSIGPTILVPISRLQRLVFNPEVSDFYYEESDIDNQRYSLALDWLYSISATHEIGLGAEVAKTDFEDEDFNRNYSTENIHAIVSGELARSKYTLNAGYTQVNRDDFEDQDAATGSLEWVLKLTGRSDASLYLASELTDSSYIALDTAETPEKGDINNVQISSDVLRDDIARIDLTRKGPTLKTRLWGELRDLDYKETLQDQEVRAAGLKMNYQIRALVSSGLYAKYKRIERTEQDRTDKLYVVGAELGYQLSRRLRAAFNLQYQNKDSTDDTREFSEFSGLINLNYGFGEIARRRTN